MGEQKYVRARYPAFHEEARMGSILHFMKNRKWEVMGVQKYGRASYPIQRGYFLEEIKY